MNILKNDKNNHIWHAIGTLRRLEWSGNFWVHKCKKEIGFLVKIDVENVQR